MENVSLENQRLKPMLKSVADMQYLTFQKLKSYEASLEDLKKTINISQIGMNNQQNSFNEDHKVDQNQNLKKNKNFINNNQMNFRFVEP